MTTQDTFTLTHYTDIAESKQTHVRQLQAEATRSAIRGTFAAIRKLFHHAPRADHARG